MKKNIRVLMTAVLLTVAMAVWAQSPISFTLENDGHKMKFSATGINITKKGKPKKKDNLTSPGHELKLDMGGTVTAGTTIKASLQKVSGKRVPRMIIQYQYRKKGSTDYQGVQFVKLDSVTSTSKDFKVHDDYEEVFIIYTYWAPNPDPKASWSWLGETQVTIKLDVGKKPEVTTPTPARPRDICDCDDSWQKALYADWSPKYRDCGVRFRDLTGDVAVRPDDEDDDAYENAEFDTILHYRDRIKTEEDSEAVLGLVNKTSFIIKEKSILVLPEYEGEVSSVKMIAGVIWVNMKKMWKNGEINCDGTQAVAGIRGTIMAMEETGSETRIWLFAGKAEMCAKKTRKKATLLAGQMSITNAKGEVTVKKFNIEQGAKKFGIPMSEITNHASPGQEFNEGNLNYRIVSDKTVEVIGVRIPGKTMQIPTQVKYDYKPYSVVGIAKQAFANQTQLTAVSIPKTVKAIAEDAFLNTSLTQVSIPGDKVSIVKNAFRNCKKLTVATVNGKSPQCSPDAFNGCSAMKELRIKGINASNNGKKLNGTNAVIRVIK